MRLAIAIVIIAVGVVWNAADAQVVSYDFNGTVTSASGTYSGASGTVTGTFTIDLSNANPAQGSGTVGAPNGWFAVTDGGTEDGTAAPVDYVFSLTADVGGFAYATDPASGGYNNSSSQSAIVAGSSHEYFGSEVTYSSADSFTQSGFGINRVGGTSWSANGLPLIASGETVNGVLRLDSQRHK